jgi:hypothetical protein
MNIFKEWIKIYYQRCFYVTNQKSTEIQEDPRPDGERN